jgi:predicted metal-dependent enzyme (double-stranded beta helix superfamily)
MNKSLPSALIPFIKQLQQLNSSKNTDEYNIEKVSLILKEWLKKDWLESDFYTVDPETGFSSWLLHEELDHSLAVTLVSWEPEREITPHDHKTWSVVGCVKGIEENYLWTRLDNGSKEGYAHIEREKSVVRCHPGDTISFYPDDIHSVKNVSDDVAISLHVYGRNLNYTNRFKYNPETRKSELFIVDFK